MKLLVCNTGSSTLKLGLFEADRERLLADTDVAQAASPARTLVIATREDLTILRETRHVLAQRS